MEQDITPWGAPEENSIPVWGQYEAGIDPVRTTEGGLESITISKQIPVQSVVCADVINLPYQTLDEILGDLYKLVPIGDHQIQENELLKIIRKMQVTVACEKYLCDGDRG